MLVTGAEYLHSKYAVKSLWCIAAIWLILILGANTLIIPISILNKIVNYRLIYLSPAKRQVTEPFEYVAMAAILVSYFLVIWFWRKATFRRKDFIQLGKKIGVNFSRKNFCYPPNGFFAPYRYADGFLQGIYVIARMDSPFWAFMPGWFEDSPYKKDGQIIPSTKVKTSKLPDYMKEEAKIALFSLVKGDNEIDVTIKIDGLKRQIPVTGILDIDSVLNETLRDEEYFHARLRFNQDCLAISIIGGSWEGGRFGDKIVKGVDIFRKLDSLLKKKYPLGSWQNWEAIWQDKFFLIPDEKVFGKKVAIREQDFLLIPRGGSK